MTKVANASAANVANGAKVALDSTSYTSTSLSFSLFLSSKKKILQKTFFFSFHFRFKVEIA